MCGLALVIAGPALSLMTGQGASAADSASTLAPVDVVEVSGLIDSIVADSIEKAIVRSQNNGAQAVIFQLNTRGAVVGRDRMTEVLTAISESKIPVAIWVGPSGARAYGLPAQMLAVADVTAMAPGARIGRTGAMLSVNGTQLTFGMADATLQAGSLGFLEAREQKVLKFSTDDRGVPVLRNMLYALDGLNVRSVTLDTVSDA